MDCRTVHAIDSTASEGGVSENDVDEGDSRPVLGGVMPVIFHTTDISFAICI